ncbi:exodeoxyribonuclease III [Synechococcus sp. PCC 7502]|uniref:exodeoxyribonuclease III n=1 Tax=Synechococcus sp. PCC 7502 TaxID=1173263 RepID=UPI00029FDBEC|nr:exodeoxyribonuclease III [Synechococcus sp. PCC 7502]AFY72219.1 exodeoxyribonuclease III [Synechococcus sp. PCC 7502]
MQIATWNVNSIRSRLDQAIAWLESRPDLDVLCLQETKVSDADFPLAPLEELGYFVYIYGQKSYNGVALIARQELTGIRNGFSAVLKNVDPEFDLQKRVISGVIGDVRIVNLYVPNGSAIASEKYEYKLKWLALLKSYLEETLKHESNILICGDFNIALEDIDIHDPAKRETKIMASDTERAALQSILDLGFKDVFRRFYDGEGHYSWWDYRAGSFRRNHGWRIDHHYATKDLYERSLSCEIDINPRKNPQPSDHTPVIVEL